MFVGDLPPGCGHYELQELFSAVANVVNIRHIEHKGIAFVTLESEAEVDHVVHLADSTGLHIHGEMIRVARAHQPSDGPVCSCPNALVSSKVATWHVPCKLFSCHSKASGPFYFPPERVPSCRLHPCSMARINVCDKRRQKLHP